MVDGTLYSVLFCEVFLMKRVLSIITFIMFVISFIRIVLYVNNSFKNKKITNITSKYIIPVRESEYLVNFDILKSMNSDTTCYLIINSIDFGIQTN